MYTKEVVIWCETFGCGEWVRTYSHVVSRARKAIRKDGWRVRAGKDICPRCLEREGRHVLLEKTMDKKQIHEGVVVGVVDRPNHNNRIYKRETMEREIARFNKEGGALGELGPSQDGRTRLANVSHRALNMRIDETGNMVGTVEIFSDTEAGKKAIEMIKAGPLTVRSRGTGTLRPDKDGNLIVQDDFHLLSFDIMKPEGE